MSTRDVPKTATGALDRAFKIGMLAKALMGLGETLLGVLLLVVSREEFIDLANWLAGTAFGSSANPWAPEMLGGLTSLASTGALFAAVYLIGHGAIKLVLVAAVLRNKLWAFPWMLALLVGFIAFQTYEMAVHFTVGLLLLTLFDAVIVWLTLFEYRKRRAARQAWIREVGVWRREPPEVDAARSDAQTSGRPPRPSSNDMSTCAKVNSRP